FQVGDRGGALPVPGLVNFEQLPPLFQQPPALVGHVPRQAPQRRRHLRGVVGPLCHRHRRREDRRLRQLRPQVADALLQAVDLLPPPLPTLLPLALLLRERTLRLGRRRLARGQRLLAPLPLRLFEVDRLFPALLRQGQLLQFVPRFAAAQFQLAAQLQPPL